MSDKRRRSSTRTPRTGRRPGESSSRQDILDAAQRLFAARGYQGATMRAIAAEAGVDAALIVHFFGNKRALLAEAAPPTPWDSTIGRWCCLMPAAWTRCGGAWTPPGSPPSQRREAFACATRGRRRSISSPATRSEGDRNRGACRPACATTQP